MSLVRSRFVVLAGLILGLSFMPGCGGSDEPVVMDPPPETTNLDPEEIAKQKEQSRQDYDPRSGSSTATGTSSPAAL